MGDVFVSLQQGWLSGISRITHSPTSLSPGFLLFAKNTTWQPSSPFSLSLHAQSKRIIDVVLDRQRHPHDLRFLITSSLVMKALCVAFDTSGLTATTTTGAVAHVRHVHFKVGVATANLLLGSRSMQSVCATLEHVAVVHLISACFELQQMPLWWLAILLVQGCHLELPKSVSAAR
jgi:hypothetical protein